MNAETPNPDAVVHYRGNDSCMTEDNAGYLIKLVSSSLNRMLDQEMAPLDLTAMQWRPVAMLYRGRADTPAELARLTGTDTGAMTRTLDRLEARACCGATAARPTAAWSSSNSPSWVKPRRARFRTTSPTC